MTPLEIQKRLALKLKLNKIDDCGIAAPILLNEILAKAGHATALVQGYCSFGGDTCWHVWVENERTALDIGYTIACLKDREFEKCTMVLHKNVATGAKEPQRDTETVDMWETHQKDSKAFWKKQPVRVQNFRAKALNEKW